MEAKRGLDKAVFFKHANTKKWLMEKVYICLSISEDSAYMTEYDVFTIKGLIGQRR
jgi:hypothetical protein